MFYGKTTDWSSVVAGRGPTLKETVNFTINPEMTKTGYFTIEVIGAGIASIPRFLHVTQAEISKR